MQGREPTESRRSGRLDGRAQPRDDRIGRGERDAGRVVRPFFLRHAASLWPELDEQLAEELRPALWAVGDEADYGVAHFHACSVALDVEDPCQSLCLPRRVVGLQMQLRQPQLVTLREELVDPLPGRMQLEPVAGVRGYE